MMKVVKIANDVAVTAKCVNNVATLIARKKENSSTTGVVLSPQKVMERTEGKLKLLQTMLKRIFESKNENLINDIKEHNIQEKLLSFVAWIERNKHKKLNNLPKSELNKLYYVVDETNSIYDQTMALIMVNTISELEEKTRL
ncbi:hypothetical protein CRE_16133 [Caenorhabditis remanei]|uniref:Uncharacterized protein n=1 Tax=Caenorhabditis remanei TaxID=31234 RepID=E3MB79_CAERE|nr:hypothetical protein CRE_16133 [Caenorhabditis remanei]